MIYYVMDGVEVIAVCSRAADAHVLAGYDHTTQKSYQVVAKMVDTSSKDAIVNA